MMFMSGVLPFSMFLLPALAGAMLISVVVEMGAKTAIMVYVSVSILSAFIIADKLAAVYFICFLGYYPIAKAGLERIRPRFLEYLVKISLFNLTVMMAYLAIVNILEISLPIAIPIPLFANIVFFIYDLGLTRYATFYTHRFRKRFLR
jgi:hypothetical protein